ncbi:putative phage related transcriptional regulator [Clostridium botulinum C str. Eklund]|nr:putative phage related transcriptional regulator [Clostridium botulinum C str. Eklund]
MTIISKRLKESRTEVNLTQQQLAEKIGVSTSIIGDIESGRRVASKKTAKKLADFFNTNSEYWFDENCLTEYFNKREKYSSLDSVVTTLIDKKIINNSNIPDEAWELIKDAIQIDLKVLLLNK